MKIKDVIQALESFAPLPLQEEYDNAGLQVGVTEAEVSGALLCLDVTEDIVAEAIEKGCNLIVAHHPLLFRALRHVTNGSLPERCVRMAVKNDVAIYAAHTNLDNALGGVNFEIARRLCLEDVKFLQTTDGKSGSGVLGRLPRSMSSKEFLTMVKERFQIDCLQHNGLIDRAISVVGLCGGAGDFLVSDAYRAGADVFLTGEMHYHAFFGWENRMQIGVMGHYQSEQFTKDLLKSILQESLPQLRLEMTSRNTNPIYYL